MRKVPPGMLRPWNLPPIDFSLANMAFAIRCACIHWMAGHLWWWHFGGPWRLLVARYVQAIAWMFTPPGYVKFMHNWAMQPFIIGLEGQRS